MINDSSFSFSVLGYSDNIVQVVNSIKEFIKQKENTYVIEDKNIWKTIATSCYGNYEKDSRVAQKISNVVISYDDLTDIVCLQTYTASDLYKPYFTNGIDGEIAKKFAELIEDPHYWITNIDTGSLGHENFFVKKVSEDDEFGMDNLVFTTKKKANIEYPTIEGFVCLEELVLQVSENLLAKFEVDNMDDITSVVDEFLKTGSDNSIKQMIDEPKILFDLNYMPMEESLDLISDTYFYSAEERCYNITKLYSDVPKDMRFYHKPEMGFCVYNIMYSLEDMDTTYMLCKIESEVMSDSYEVSLIDDTVEEDDDFFSS